MPNQKNETKEPKTQKTPKDKVIDASVRGKKPAAAEHRYYQNRKRQQAAKKVAPVKIAFLGGLNEVGKNITLYEYGNDMFLVDCGLAFPDQDMPGVDLVLPDFTYLERNADKIRGIVITHGHEDHIGGLAYLMKTLNIPIYATRLTIGLIQGKFKEHGLLNTTSLNVVKPGDHIPFGAFDVELIHVNHSIPDAVALAIRCKAGTIIQTGDFKIDTTPIDGEMIDLARFAEIGKEACSACSPIPPMRSVRATQKASGRWVKPFSAFSQKLGTAG